MNQRNVAVFLFDIVECCEDIEGYLAGSMKESFLEDTKTQDAVVRRLEIIGEAVRRLPLPLREKYTDVPWREVSGMRDVLIHGYFSINVERVWETAQNDVPKLKEQVEKILKENPTL